MGKDKRIDELDGFKSLSEGKNDIISSEPATLIKLAKTANMENAPLIAKGLSISDDKAAIGAFFSMCENFKLGADAGDYIYQPNWQFVNGLLKYVEENSAISGRGFLRADPKLKDEYIGKYGEPNSNKERVLMENEVCFPRVSFYYGIHPSMDKIAGAAMPVVVNTEVYDDEWTDGYTSPQITKNMKMLKEGIAMIPDKPPQKLKELLKDAIESNWMFCISECGVEASTLMLGALAKHHGNEPDVQKYFAKLYAECVSAQVIVQNSNTDYTYLHYQGSSTGWTIRAYTEMAAGIRDIVAQHMPELLKEMKAKANPARIAEAQKPAKENGNKILQQRQG